MMVAVLAAGCVVPVNAHASRECSVEGSERSVSSGCYCNLHVCSKDGCYEFNDTNGTIYCNRHAAEYARNQGYIPCSAYGCYRKPSKGHSYCSTHECSNSDCHNIKVSGSDYCKSHQPKPVTTKKTATTKSSYSYTPKKTGSSTGSSTKKYDPYNVYSYKSAQDFADDKYEEFFDYEDDYEDEDEAYDAAEDYWYDHH